MDQAIEGLAAAQRRRNVIQDIVEPVGSQYLYVVEVCTRSILCRGCNQQIVNGRVRVVFQRASQRQLCSAHMSCLANLEGLVRPPATAVYLSEQLAQDDRDAAETYLASLPSNE